MIKETKTFRKCLFLQNLKPHVLDAELPTPSENKEEYC